MGFDSGNNLKQLFSLILARANVRRRLPREMKEAKAIPSQALQVLRCRAARFYSRPQGKCNRLRIILVNIPKEKASNRLGVYVKLLPELVRS